MWERPGLYGAIRPEMGPPQPGDTAPDFDLPAAGAGFRLSSLRGSWVVLHFTASWCPYCDAEVDHLGRLSEAYASRNVKVVLIGVKEEPARWSEYTKGRIPASVVVLSDEQGDAARRYAPPHAQPSFQDRAQVPLDATVIVDPEGTLRLFLFPDSKHFDPTFAAVRGELDRLMAAGSKEPSLLAAERVVTVEVAPAPRVQAGGRGEVLVG
jgi:peroxiredoxin